MNEFIDSYLNTEILLNTNEIREIYVKTDDKDINALKMAYIEFNKKLLIDKDLSVQKLIIRQYVLRQQWRSDVVQGREKINSEVFKRKDLFAAIKSGCIFTIVGTIVMMTSMLFSSNTHIKRVLHPTVSSSIIYLVNNARELLHEFQ